jgi:hypothetical protein
MPIMFSTRRISSASIHHPEPASYLLGHIHFIYIFCYIKGRHSLIKCIQNCVFVLVSMRWKTMERFTRITISTALSIPICHVVRVVVPLFHRPLALIIFSTSPDLPAYHHLIPPASSNPFLRFSSVVTYSRDT